MYLLTITERQDNGAYAVLNRYGEKVLFMFEEEDDAERYAMMLEGTGEPIMKVMHVADRVAIAACEKTGTRYTVIGKDDFVIPVKPK